MKKTIIFFAALVAVFAFSACSSDVTEDTQAPVDLSKIKINITVADLGGEASTRAMKTNWVAGDVINIWFGNHFWMNYPNMKITFNGTEWQLTSGGSTELMEGTTFKAVYEGTNTHFNNLEGYRLQLAFPTSTIDATTVANTPMCCVSGSIPFTYDSGTSTLTAAIDTWTYMTPVQVVVSGLEGSPADYSLQVNGLKSVAGFTATDESRNVFTPIYSATPAGGVANADGVAFYMDVDGSAAGDPVFTLRNKDGKQWTYTAAGKTFSASSTKCTGIKIAFSKFSEVQSGPALTGTAKATINGNEVDVNWIQLWENGPKWAEYNVGQSSQTDFNRDYRCSWTEADNAWGSNWRMPTYEEMAGLFTNCNFVHQKTITLVGAYNGCWTFQGKGDYAGKMILFMGDTNGSSDTGGDYWTSDTYYGDHVAFEYYYDGDLSYQRWWDDGNYFVRLVLNEQ